MRLPDQSTSESAPLVMRSERVRLIAKPVVLGSLSVGFVLPCIGSWTVAYILFGNQLEPLSGLLLALIPVYAVVAAVAVSIYVSSRIAAADVGFAAQPERLRSTILVAGLSTFLLTLLIWASYLLLPWLLSLLSWRRFR